MSRKSTGIVAVIVLLATALYLPFSASADLLEADVVGALEPAASREEALQVSPAVTLNRLLAAHQIEAREPLGVGVPHLNDGSRVYVFIDVRNPDGPEGELTVSWHHNDRDREYEQTIEYGTSPRWRTWVARRMVERHIGSWSVTVSDAQGVVVGDLDFEVQATQAPVADINQ